MFVEVLEQIFCEIAAELLPRAIWDFFEDGYGTESAPGEKTGENDRHV
jgi:hypothetical protein